MDSIFQAISSSQLPHISQQTQTATPPNAGVHFKKKGEELHLMNALYS